MSGTTESGKKAAVTTKARHGADFHKRSGARGGLRCVPKGFGLDKELARTAGAKGGRISRRGPAVKRDEGLSDVPVLPDTLPL